MSLSLIAAIAVSLSLPQGTGTQDPCEPAREEEFLAALKNDSLKDAKPESFVQAIECLGKLRSVAAVNPLIDLLSYRRTFWWDGTGAIPSIVLPTDRYPAGRALARIGKPALPSVVQAVSASAPDSMEHEVLYYILFRVFLDDEQEGLSFLKKAAITADSVEGKERLLEMAQRYAAHNGLKKDEP